MGWESREGWGLKRWQDIPERTTRSWPGSKSTAIGNSQAPERLGNQLIQNAFVQCAKLVTRGSLDIMGSLAGPITAACLWRVFLLLTSQVPRAPCTLGVSSVSRQVAAPLIPLFEEGHLEVKRLFFFHFKLITTFCSCYLQVHELFLKALSVILKGEFTRWLL